jgi:hypothetical protein
MLIPKRYGYLLFGFIQTLPLRLPALHSSAKEFS